MSAEPATIEPAHPLIEMPDKEFSEAWRTMDAEQRYALPVAVRGACFDRYRRLTPYIEKGIERMRRAQARLDAELPQITAAWHALDLELLAEREPEPPRFIVPNWLPVGYATLFAGHGGVGKSGIALYLAVCFAAGRPFFGIDIVCRRVMYLSCEDRENVLHWRLTRICAHLGISLASLRRWLVVVDLVGEDCVLWERDPKTGHTFTPAYGRLEQAMQEHDTQVLFVDGVSDTYGGQENNRAEVKRYINALVALIPADEGAVVLIGHIAKPAATSGQTSEGYSGSTGWHNGVRARWYLYPESVQNAEGETERTGDLLLELQKSNLGRTDQSMRFSWDEDAHLFLGREIVGATPSDIAHRNKIEQSGILRAFRACAEASQPIAIPAATTGPRTAFNVLSVAPGFPDTLRKGKVGRSRFWHHIEKLRAMQLVRESSITRADRHKVVTLELTEEGVRACGQ